MFFAWFPIFVLTRRLVPWLTKCRIAVSAPAASAMRGAKPLANLREIKELLAGIGVENDCADGHFQNCVRARVALAIRAFAVPPAFRSKFAVVAISKQRVVVRIGFQVHVAAMAAVAARWPAARNILLPAERDAAVSAVAALHQDSGLIYEHGCFTDKTYTKNTPRRDFLPRKLSG